MSINRAARTSEETLKIIQSAFSRLSCGQTITVPIGTRVTVSALALEAGVDRATLYRSHSDFVDQIRKITRTPKLVEKRSLEKEYRALTEEAQMQVQLLANINYRQKLEGERIQLELDAQIKIVSELRKKIFQCESDAKSAIRRVR